MSHISYSQQVITGLVPSQMLPMSHSAAGIVAQPGDIGTPGAIPPGHVTNLMLPSHLSSQPIPVHAVTLMSMTSGQPQVVYSMSSQPSVHPALISSTVTTSTSLPASSHLPGTVTAAPGVPLSVGSSNDVTIQHQSTLPQITTVQSAATMQPGNVNGSSLSSQMSGPGVAPISIQSQVFAPSSVRYALSKQELTQSHVQPSSAIYTGMPSLGTNNLRDNSRQLHQTAPEGVLNSTPGVLKSEGIFNSGSVVKPDDTLNTENTFVVEMKPVVMKEGKAVPSPGSTPNDNDNPPMPIRFVTDVPEVAREIVSGNEFEEPTLTLSEEGVVQIDEASQNALQAGAELHRVNEGNG